MMRLQSISRSVLLTGLLIGTITCPALTQTKKKAPVAAKPPVKNEVKAQGQVVGLNGQFGVTYTLRNDFNFTLLSAHYTLEPYIAYALLTAGADEKLMVLDIAMKNVAKEDNYFNSEGFMTLVDEKGQLYPGGNLALKSLRAAAPNTLLKPGQGMGQPALKDPLQLGFTIPAKARIVKIIVNKGRAGKAEDVIRYYIAGATKEEAGEAGDPKNVLTSLTENVRDTSDKSGAVALPQGKIKIGETVPSGYFALRLDNFAYSTDPLNGNPPDDGKKFAIATVTVKNLTPTEVSFFDVSGGDFPAYEITDSDGEREKPTLYRKAKRDEDPEHTFKQGDEYTFRVVFLLPKDATAKQLVLGTSKSRKWGVDVSGVK